MCIEIKIPQCLNKLVSQQVANYIGGKEFAIFFSDQSHHVANEHHFYCQRTLKIILYNLISSGLRTANKS